MICKGEDAPADLLLMDCKGDKKVMVDESRILGTEDYVQKSSVESFKIFRDLDHNEIFERLEEVKIIQATLPDCSFKEFEAKIRYWRDSKHYFAGLNNFIIGGSSVTSSDWILGLIIYAGMESKLWLNFKLNKKQKITNLTLKQNQIFSINFVIILLLILLSVLIASSKSSQMFDFILNESIIWFILLYSNLISISYYLVLNISKILSACFIMIKNKKFKIDPMSLQELGRVEYLLVDKEILVKHKHMKISSLFIKGLNFLVDDEIKKRTQRNIGSL